jgi:hypothetical protein
VKPSVEYLDSLNAYRKRARSPEMDLFDEPESKAPRLADAPPTEPALLGDGEDEMEGVPLASGDDPIVYGRPQLRACECRLMTSTSQWRSDALLGRHGRASRAHDRGRVHCVLRRFPGARRLGCTARTVAAFGRACVGRTPEPLARACFLLGVCTGVSGCNGRCRADRRHICKR